MLKLLCELLSEMVIYVEFYYRLGRVNAVVLGQLKISNVYNINTGFGSPGAPWNRPQSACNWRMENLY